MATPRKKFDYKLAPQQRPHLTKNAVGVLNLAADYLEAGPLKSMRAAKEAGLHHRDLDKLETAVRWIRKAGLWYASRRIGSTSSKPIAEDKL